MKKALLAFPLVIALAGCQIPNVQLPQLPAPTDQPAAAGSDLTIPAKKGQNLNISVPVPARICESDVYLVGVKVGYVNHWNQVLQERAFMHHLAYKNTPNSRTRHNNDLYYSAPVYSQAGIHDATVKYGNFAKKEDGRLSPCTFNSFTAGRTKGQELAQADFTQLRSKEQ